MALYALRFDIMKYKYVDMSEEMLEVICMIDVFIDSVLDGLPNEQKYTDSRVSENLVVIFFEILINGLLFGSDDETIIAPLYSSLHTFVPDFSYLNLDLMVHDIWDSDAFNVIFNQLNSYMGDVPLEERDKIVISVFRRWSSLQIQYY